MCRLSQAVPGLRRLHERLIDDGWEVTSYREGKDGQDWSLFVRRDDGDERMSFTWFPDREYFMGVRVCPAPTTPPGRRATSVPPGAMCGRRCSVPRRKAGRRADPCARHDLWIARG